MRAKAVTGASLICYINGQPVGRVLGFSFRTQTPKRAIYGIDSMTPFELAPTQARVNGTLRLLRTVGDAGAQGAGLGAGHEEIETEKYFTLMIVERGSDKVYFQAQFCSVTGQSWEANAKSVVTGSVDFEALAWSNEVQALGS